MKFSDRVSVAWAVLTGARQEKAVANLIPTWQENTPAYNDVNFEKLVRYGYRRNELIFACISKTANTAAQVQLKVTRESDDEEIPNHPLKQLIDRPNPFMNEFDFWASVIIYQKLAGRAIYEKVRSKAGRVAQLWPLRPDWIQPIQSSAGVVSGYKYSPPNVDAVFLDPGDVVDFKLFDPLNRYSGWPPAAVAGRVGDVDNAATDYLKLFFEKGGTPPGLLKTKQALIDAQVESLRVRWAQRYGGYEHWLSPAILDSDAEYQKIGLTFTEMGFDVLDARDEARICMVLQVPPILIGAKIGLDRATYSNYGEARKAWWQDDLVPLYANFVDVLDNSLTPEFGQGLSCQFDYSRVPALAEDRKAVWQIANDALRSGGITVNEYCAEIGLSDKGPSGDVYLRSASILEVPVDGARPEPEPVAESQPEDETGSGGNVEPIEESEKSLSVDKAQPPPDAATRRRHERIITRAMEDYLADQSKRVAKEAGKNGR